MSTRREFLAVASTSFLAARRIKSVSSPSAPKAIGPYSQAVRAGNALYLSGQIAIDPATGNLVTGDFTAQARRVFENLKAVLHEAGADFRNVVKATVYLTDVANFQTLNSIYSEFF